MTFTDIVAEICNRLNYTSTTAISRVGTAVNRKYKLLTTSLGIDRKTRPTQVQATIAQGTSTLTFAAVTKISNVIDKSSGQDIVLPEISMEEMRRRGSTNTTPQCYAVLSEGANTVTIQLDCVAQTTFTLYADGTAQAGTLSGTMVPAFDEDFHEILIEAVLVDEYRKLEKPGLAQVSKQLYDEYISALRMHLQKSAYADITIKKSNPWPFVGGTAAAGGGSAPNGGTSYTQTGLITFDRTGQAPGSKYPFAVAAGSEKVANLDADKLDGLDWTTVTVLPAVTTLAALLLPESQLTFTDIVTNNVSATKHGFVPKYPNNTTTFFRGDGAYQQVDETGIVLADVATLNVSTTKHGLAPKAPNDATKFLDGTGAYSVPSGVNICTAVSSTGTVNNLAPTTLVSGVLNIIPVTSAADLILTGLSSSGLAAGTRARFISTGAGNVYYKNLNAGSSAANQFKNWVTSGDTPISKGVIEFEFDGTNWVLHFHEQGSAITPTFAAGNFTGNGSMTWTVGSGDVTTCKWILRGKFVTVTFSLTTTTIGGTPNTSLQIGNGAYGGFTLFGEHAVGCMVNDNGGGFVGGFVQASSGASTTSIAVLRSALAVWSASTDSTAARGQITFEVS